MHAPPDRVFEADEILVTLAEYGVDFVVVGGIAVQTHGYIRGTHDLDVIARPTALNFSRLSEVLRGPARPSSASPGTLKLTDPQPAGEGAADPGHYQGRSARRRPRRPHRRRARRLRALRESALIVDFRGHDVAVAGLRDLIRMKRAAGRDQDLMDIEALTHDPEST